MLAALVDGVRSEGAEPRLVRVRRSADVAFIGHDGARLSGSGIAVGIQSKGTALIHRADLEPLDNLELFGMAPSLTLESYRQIGANAAGYALGRPVAPVPTVLDNYARAKLIVRTTLLHARETAEVERDAAAGRADGLRGRLRRWRRAALVPGLPVPSPAVRVVPLDDHPGVLSQLGRVERLEERLGQALDQPRLELRGQPALEQLDADERHLASPRARTRRRGRARGRARRSGTWSSGTGASASMKLTPDAEKSLWRCPRLTTTTSPGLSVRVSSSIVISTSPSRMNITCSVSSCACQGTSLPGSY